MTQPTNPSPKRRWFRFSLRTLLVVVVLLCLPLGWFAARLRDAERQRKAVEAIRAAGGAVKYDYQEAGGWGAEPNAPAWLREVVGDDFFSDVVEVHLLGTTFGDESMEHLKRLTNLNGLGLNDTQVTDAGLDHIKRLPSLEALYLGGTDVTDAGLKSLKGLKTLEVLSLCDTEVADAGLVHLQTMTNLKSLVLSRTQVTDAGLEYIKGLTHLEDLVLSETQITDAGLMHLNGLTNLRTMLLSDTQVTEEGIEELRKALPNCGIDWGAPRE